MVSNVPTTARHRLDPTAERITLAALQGDAGGSIAKGLAELRLQTARAVLWHYGDEHLGLQPGGFMTLILQAFDRADQQNFAKLSDAFPLYGKFVREVKFGDIENVRRIVKVAAL